MRSRTITLNPGPAPAGSAEVYAAERYSPRAEPFHEGAVKAKALAVRPAALPLRHGALTAQSELVPRSCGARQGLFRG